jgi:serine/threonine protein phosphatase PrpC
MTSLVAEGFRITMEDTHTIKTSLSQQHADVSFFGIYDGHAGDKCSIFLEQRLWQAVAALKDPTNPAQLREAYLKVDAEFLKREDERSHGSAAVVAMVRTPKEEKGDKKERKYAVTVSNLGDSRVLLIKADGKCIPLTTDHKPENEKERERITKAGGFVQANRVDGQLAMSRAFGDSPYKDNAKVKAEEQKVCLSSCALLSVPGI